MEQYTTEAPRKLYKSRRDRMIDGVCGGIAEYFGVDPTIIRVVWVLITLMGGTGFILYIAGMIIIPTNPADYFAQPGSVPAPPPNGKDKKRFWGVLLIIAGTTFLVINLGWFADYHWWSFSRSVLLPSFLIVAGAFLIYIHTNKKNVAQPSPVSTDGGIEPQVPPQQSLKELRRSITDKKLFGVCGGIAQYFNIDSTIVRILYICLVIASFGWGLLLYIILGLLMPEERLNIRST